jgi:hypothetical protein
MKVAELLNSPLSEGTWSLPDTMHKVKEVFDLLKEPIKWSDNRKLKRVYHLLGDDDLFDDFDRAKDDRSPDVRDVIVKHLPRLLNTATWSQRPDDATQFAVNMLKKKYGIR